MIAYNLDTLQSAENLARICGKYKDKLDVNVIHGGYTIDGCSILGVVSLLGKIVSLEVVGVDEEIKDDFCKEIRKLI